MHTRLPHRIWQSAILLLLLAIAGCTSAPRKTDPAHTAKSGQKSSTAPALPPAGSGRGGYYKDDGPENNPPANLEATPDATPKVEPLLPRANRPYNVFGNTYKPIPGNSPFVQKGIGSWYGKKFHGRKTSSGEPYDMYKMTAAHPTLPIPSYSRITNLDNGKQVIVRINDRGPFHSNRIIDLSYTAALKLGYLGKGSGLLQVEHLRPEEIEQIARSRQDGGEPGNNISQGQPLQPNVNDYPPLTLDASETSAPVSAPTAPSLTGYYLQLGSFAQEHNAKAMRAQYALTWADKLPPAQVVQKDTFYRIYAGPFTSRRQAAEAAQKMQESGAPKPLIIER